MAEDYEIAFLNNANDVKKQNKQPDSTKSEMFDWLEVLATAVILLVVLFTFVFKVVSIDGDSMTNTLMNNERVVISSVNYTPAFGDIVVISRNANNLADFGRSDSPLIKRIIAVAGQTVNIDFDKGIVYVDGVALDEPYTRTPTNLIGDVKFPVYVPDGYVFVLGDNRNDSADSRFTRIGENGLIDVRTILGKAILRVFPFNKFGGLYGK